MQFSDLFQETYFALRSNKSRSVLTILGIVIGIGSVIAMISIGQGAAANISANIESLGSNLLVVMPGSQRYLTGNNSVSNINAQITQADLMTTSQEQITNLLLIRHKIADPLQ
ncbi:MAG: ABC transporter permease, partial [Patescibacteria group bacterium]